jgi:hypothetical protein
MEPSASRAETINQTTESLDYDTLLLLKEKHPAWGLLRADLAPLVVSYIQKAFITPNVRSLPQSEAVECLEDCLHSLRIRFDRPEKPAFPASALEYLNAWADSKRGWLRKFYATRTDEPHFEPTSAAEKAIRWLTTLTERGFVGTESRLLTAFELLRQIMEGSETDPETRLAELQRRRDELDEEMTRIRTGNAPILTDTAIKDRFQQFTQLARELLSDFREVEQNFRQLDRIVRERIAGWDGSKGTLVGEILGERDDIADSDQGRSFRAFCAFLQSERRQDEWDRRLAKVLSLSSISTSRPDPRLRRIHYDWLDAGESTQRTVAQLSQQLRRFLDDQAWMENKRIMKILHRVEALALSIRTTPPIQDGFMELPGCDFPALPMERRLFTPASRTRLTEPDLNVEEGEEIDLWALRNMVVINCSELAGHIRQALQTRAQITIRELLELHPLRHGLAELVGYLQLAGLEEEKKGAMVDDERVEVVEWPVGDGLIRRAYMPSVTFLRHGS